MVVRLAGNWATTPNVKVGGVPVAATYAGGVLSIPVGIGTSTIQVG
jgi:hypothetical protein